MRLPPLALDRHDRVLVVMPALGTSVAVGRPRTIPHCERRDERRPGAHEQPARELRAHRSPGRARNWYHSGARAYLAELTPDRVDALDAAFGKLDKQESVELAVCFLGSAGVGKSTLLNAIVAGDRTLVPQGGVGPLTAQATLVRYSSERRFRATYLRKGHLNNVLFALERDHERELERQGQTVDRASAPEIEISDEDQLEIEAALATADSEIAHDASMDPRERLKSYASRARLLVLGEQFADADDPERGMPYVMDGLRDILGQPRRWGTAAYASDTPRIARIREALAAGAYEQAAGASLEEIRDEIKLHASGFLSPLIKSLEVWWDAEHLKDGLVLVDLPGVGVANDEYRRVTAAWIREARAVVLVVDRAGVTEDAAELLRQNGFLNSLLHEGDDPDAEPAMLLVAATKLDDVANSNWRGEREHLGREKARKWIEHFDEVCDGMKDVLRGQVQRELEKIADAGPEATRDARYEVVRKVLSTLQIHPLSASEYRTLLRNDDEDRAQIRKEEDSRVPAFTEALCKLARHRVELARARNEQRVQNAYDRVRGELAIVLEQWREGARAEEESARLRAELDVISRPLLDDLTRRQGAFREFLRESMPREIKARTLGASKSAEKDIRQYLMRHYKDYHWATLRAAIRRGGFYDRNKRRQVDLPKELTDRFEDPLAVLWSKELLVELRKRTRELGEDYVRLVEQVLEWALSEDARVRRALVDNLREEVKAEVRGLSSVGKEAIDELRERVKKELYQHVQDEVQKHCHKFIKSKRASGAGTKQNILEFLGEELPGAVVEAARPAAERVLEANYAGVSKEITEAFKVLANPVQRAIDVISSAHGESVKRSDAQRRRKVIDEGERLLAALPAVAL